MGGLFKTDRRLYVGGRDCSHLAENMGWQVEAVHKALMAAVIDLIPTITAVLCFVDGEWPLLSPPHEYKGVQLEGMRSINKHITGVRLLELEVVVRAHHVLALAFPPK